MFLRKLSLFLALVMLCTLSAATAESLVEVILTTGTTQAFTDEAIPADDLNTIVRAGLQATSAINQQPWYFAVVTNADIMAEISAGSGFGGAPAGMPAGGPDASFGGSSGMSAAAADTTSGASATATAPAAPAAPASSGAAKAALGDSPVAIIIYMNEASMSPNASFDCGLACQNMVIAASALGYGTKIISSPTNALNGANHDALCEKLGVDPSLTAVAVLLIGTPDVDAVSTASVRKTVDELVSFVD